MRLPTFVLTFLLALPGFAPAADTPRESPPRVTLTGADCLDPSRMRTWHTVNSRELLVDAGRRKYRITLAESCTELGGAPTIGFRGDRVSGRVCGHFGERVITRRRSCRIERIELIDAEAFREATARPRGRATAGATQP
jgi:hypothetical protein